MSWLFWLLVAFPLLTVAASLVATWIAVALLERAYPPIGEFVSADGARLHLVDIAGGAGCDSGAPPVLLLHGANLCLEDMRMSLGAQLTRSFRVIIPDRPGQGYSEIGVQRDLSPGAQASLVRSALRASGIGRVIVVGHSLGGLIALRYALDYPQDVVALALINPTSHPRANDLPMFQRAAGFMLGPVAACTIVAPLAAIASRWLSPKLFQPEPAPADYASRSALALGMTPRRFLASLREYAGLRGELTRHANLYAGIMTPTIVIAGADDPITPPAVHAEALAAALPNARLLVVGGTGHMIHHTRTDVVVSEIELLAGHVDVSPQTAAMI